VKLWSGARSSKAYVANLLPGQFVQPFVDAAFSDLGLDPNVLLPSQRTDRRRPARTPALRFPIANRSGRRAAHDACPMPSRVNPMTSSAVPQASRCPAPAATRIGRPLPAPPTGGPPPGPPRSSRPIRTPRLHSPSRVFVPAAGEPAPAPGASHDQCTHREDHPDRVLVASLPCRQLQRRQGVLCFTADYTQTAARWRVLANSTASSPATTSASVGSTSARSKDRTEPTRVKITFWLDSKYPAPADAKSRHRVTELGLRARSS